MPGIHPADPLISLTELDLARRELPLSAECGGHVWPGLSVSARTIRKEEFGGDFQFAAPATSERCSLILGTVCGSGILAALTRTALWGEIRPCGPTIISSNELIRRLDGQLSEINARLKDQQITCSIFHAVVDRAAGVVECSHVGHTRAFLRLRNGRLLEVPPAGNRLGAGGGICGPSDMYELSSVERIVVCSEGALPLLPDRGLATEAAWLRDVVTRTFGTSLDAQLDSLIDAVYSRCEYIGGPARDVTFLAAEFAEEEAADPERAMAEWVRACRRLGGEAADPSIFLG